MAQESSGSHRPEKKKKSDYWALKVFLFSFVLSVMMAWLSQEVIVSLNVIPAFIVLVVIVAIGILFDMIGLAVATADEKPFHAMASRRVKEGKTAVWLVRNAGKVSNICNDVIGDIAGVVSGATGSAIVLSLYLSEQSNFVVNLLVTGLVSAITVGGKAAEKNFAMSHSNEIVHVIARVLCVFARDPNAHKRSSREKNSLKKPKK